MSRKPWRGSPASLEINKKRGVEYILQHLSPYEKIFHSWIHRPGLLRTEIVIVAGRLSLLTVKELKGKNRALSRPPVKVSSAPTLFQ